MLRLPHLTRLGPAPLLLAALCAPLLARAGDTTPAAQLAHWSQQAGAPGDATRGRQFFTSRHGREWSCASCHGAVPLSNGQHARTGKTLAPLAPAANDRALTDAARTDKWLRRNCGDVLGRECTPLEKADVLAFLVGLKP